MKPTASLDGGFGVAGVFAPYGETFYALTTNTVQAFSFNPITSELGDTPFFTVNNIDPQPTFFGMEQIAISSDGEKLYVGETNEVNVYSAENGNLLDTITHSTLSGQSTGITLQPTSPDNLIEGTEGPDSIPGTSNSEVIRGLGGNDNINGNGGRDTLIGGGGNDNINGASGDELIYAGPGDDYINGNGGNDRISTGTGNDTITTGSGNDFINTGSGLDLVQLNGGNDIVVLLPGEGYDTIRNFQLGSIGNPRTQFKAGDFENLSFEDFGNGVNISLGSDLLAFVDNVRASTLNANRDAIFI